MRLLLIFFILTSSIFALSINDSLLKIHATLLPKITLMDYELKNKLINDSITIAIVYNKKEYKSAVSLRNKIDTKYQNGIKNHSIKTKIVLYKSIKNTKANIYYLFPSNKKNIKNVIDIAKENQALTFSYLKDNLKSGVMISINIGERVQPIINIDAIRTAHINLRPVLLSISTIYKQDVVNLLINFKSTQIKPIYLAGLDKIFINKIIN